MDDNERVVQALHEFENMTDADKVLTQELEEVFVQIAHTGRTQIPWIYLKPVFMFKLDRVMRDFFESSPSRNSSSSEPTHTAEFDVMRQRLLDCIESFTSAPFTVQRLCELMIEPKRHYKSSDKFMRGVEKNVLVVSTMTDIEGEELTNSHESTSIPNGPVTNGIITPASSTEMTSVTECESNGKYSEHYHDSHYPTEEELQHVNGNTPSEKKEDKEDTRIEESESIEDNISDEKPSDQPKDNDDKTSESEDIPQDKCNEDDSPLEQKPLEEPSTELDKQEESNIIVKEEEKSTNNSEEEKDTDDNKEDTKEDSKEQTDEAKENNEESKQEEVPTVNDEEPMEE